MVGAGAWAEASGWLMRVRGYRRASGAPLAFAAVTRSDRRFGTGRPALPAGFGVVWATVAMDMVGFGIMLPVLPLYAEDFGASPAMAAAVIAVFSAAQMVAAPLWGRLSDRIGRKPVLIAALIGSSIGSLVTGLAGVLWILFLGRVLDGASGSAGRSLRGGVRGRAADRLHCGVG